MIDEHDVGQLAEEATEEHLDELFAGINSDSEQMTVETTPLAAQLEIND